MNLTDWIGAAGVSILLAAFWFNLTRRISSDSKIYASLNLLGAFLACCASVLLNYWPFIVLEAIWTLVSLVSLISLLRRK